MEDEQASIDYKPPFSEAIAVSWSVTLAQLGLDPSDQNVRFAKLLHADRFDPSTFESKLKQYSEGRWNGLLESERMKNYQPELDELGWRLWNSGKPPGIPNALAATPTPLPVAETHGVCAAVADRDHLGQPQLQDQQHSVNQEHVYSERAAATSLHTNTRSTHRAADALDELHPGIRPSISTGVRGDSHLLGRPQQRSADMGPGSSTPRHNSLGSEDRPGHTPLRATDLGHGTITPRQLSKHSSVSGGPGDAYDQPQQGHHSGLKNLSSNSMHGSMDARQHRGDLGAGSFNTAQHSRQSGSWGPHSSSAMLEGQGGGMHNSAHDAPQRDSLNYGSGGGNMGMRSTNLGQPMHHSLGRVGTAFPPQHSLSSGNQHSAHAPSHISQHRSLDNSNLNGSANRMSGRGMQSDSSQRLDTRGGHLSSSQHQSGSHAQHISSHRGSSGFHQQYNQQQGEFMDGSDGFVGSDSYSDQQGHTYNNRVNGGGGGRDLRGQGGGTRTDPCDAFPESSEPRKLATKLKASLFKYQVLEEWHKAAYQLINYQADEQPSVRDLVDKMVLEDNGRHDLSLFDEHYRFNVSQKVLSKYMPYVGLVQRIVC